MNYTSFFYYIMVSIVVLLYYLLPKRVRWGALLLGSCAFYYIAVKDPVKIAVFFFSIAASYIGAIAIHKTADQSKAVRRTVLFLSIAISASPFLLYKAGDFIAGSVLYVPKVPWIVPLGISFYSMQIIAYLSDVYMGRILPQRNFAKYCLFISFFPQIIQGPIPRYKQLGGQLFGGNDFEYRNLVRGTQLIIWGFFLKLMIADKAAVAVNTIFDRYPAYLGMYVLVGGILYSLQLYTDFLACTTLSQGVSELFGIHLINNFERPYFSRSIKEFWRRWHISLSHWLRDYVYIPLGGNRKGTLSKYKNLIVTFAVSGIWHGGSWKFLFWGLLHAAYQLMGGWTYKIRDGIYDRVDMPKDSLPRRLIQTIGTFFWAMLAWIIFRASSLKGAIKMIASIFIVHNPWILFDDSLLKLGLVGKDWNILIVSLTILLIVSILQERQVKIRDWINDQHAAIRWPIYILAIWAILLFGTYGFGFNAQDFIYGGF